MRLNQLSKHFCHSDWGISKTCILNASTASLGVKKRWPLILFFTYGNKKKSFGVRSQDSTADDSSNRCFECSKMQMFEPMCESSHCRGEEWSVFDDWFSWFLGRQLANKCLYITKNWLFCVVQVVRLQHVQFFWITGDYLLGSASCASNFCWIWLILKHPYSRLLFTFGLIRVNPRFITCHDAIDEIRKTAIVFLEHFFRKIDISIFLSDWQIEWDPTWTNLFDNQMFMQYWMYAGSH